MLNLSMKDTRTWWRKGHETYSQLIDWFYFRDGLPIVVEGLILPLFKGCWVVECSNTDQDDYDGVSEQLWAIKEGLS